MKSFTLLVLLLAVYTICPAQKFTFNQGLATTKNYYDEIPYENVNGKIFITVEIAGKKHKFLLDTGAPVMLDKQIINDLKLQAIHKDNIMDVSGQVDSVTTVLLTNLKIGNVDFTNVAALSGIPQWYHCWGADGVVGSNILRNSIISIDDRKHIVTLTDQLNQLPFLDSKKSTKLSTNTDDQSTPMVKFTLKDKVNIDLEFDSGDNGFIRITGYVMDQLIKLKACDVIAKGYGADVFGVSGLQKPADKYLVKFPFITIANTRFDNASTAVNSTGVPGLGTKLLDFGVVTLDYIHGKFYMNTDKPAYDVVTKHWPFQVTTVNDKLVVGLVYPQAADQVKIGQQVLAIDDVEYPKASICDWIEIKPKLEAKDAATFTIKDEQGNVEKIQVSKQ